MYRSVIYNKKLWLPLLLTFVMIICGAWTRPSSVVTIEDQAVPLAAASVLMPSTGPASTSSNGATIDISNASEGYVMCRYSGSNNKIKVQITKNGGTTYTYDLNTGGKYEVFPLTSGDGTYSIQIYENITGSQYALAHAASVEVALRSNFLPFLYPSQYVNFSADSPTVKKAEELTLNISADLDKVRVIYEYVVGNITYDTQKAATVQSGYLPVIDTILSSGTGICFDYTAVMAAMLRSQGIPTQMRVGYVSGGVYHSWLNVYTPETGWINGIVYFDGKTWKLMDPTFASSGNQSAEIMQFIGNGTNYSSMYTY